MNTKMKLCLVFYSAAVLIVFLLGLVYAFNSSFMPYHAEVVGTPWAAISPEFQWLILALMKAFGVTMLSLSFALAAMVWIPLRRNEIWAKVAVPIAIFVYALPILWIPLWLKSQTGAGTPWMLAAIGNLLSVAGLVLSLGPRKEAGFGTAKVTAQ